MALRFCDALSARKADFHAGRLANRRKVHRCAPRGEVRRRVCNQAGQTAADLRWREDERYGAREKERQRRREGRPVPSSRTELTERHTEVYIVERSRENRSKNRLLQPRPLYSCIYPLELASAFAAIAIATQTKDCGDLLSFHRILRE